jgi:hypothetical protein
VKRERLTQIVLVIVGLLNPSRLGFWQTRMNKVCHAAVDMILQFAVQVAVQPTEPEPVALELGSETQLREEVRDIWLNRWLRDFVHDLRFSARSIVRSPSLTAAAVLTLALGIGATTALYSLIDQIVLRALPVDHPERLVLFNWDGEQLAETFGSDHS